jgi:alpha-galactosidase
VIEIFIETFFCERKTMRVSIHLFICLGVVLVGTSLLCAVSPTAAEFGERDIWVAAKFLGTQKEPEVESGLVVLANFNPVLRNQHLGQPLKIKDQKFERGLFCHAPSKILVRLPSAGKTFSSMAGIDTNVEGGGSVVFSVSVKGENAYRSEVKHRHEDALPVTVDLQNAKEFAIEISDAGDGNASDQSCWAQAKVTLTNGNELWLDEMQIIDAGKKPYDATPFFSFNYNGRPSSEFLADWKLERSSKKLDDLRREHTLTYSDPKTNLVIRCVGVVWKNVPTVEWTLYFKNEANADTPILEAIQAIDTTFNKTSQGEFVLHYNKGDRCSVDSFEPMEAVLSPDKSQQFASVGGRPTNFQWPYYNIECPQQREGMIFVIGWPGQWASQFKRNAGFGLQVIAGQELTHFKLHPGEEIRTPLVVLQFYKGDWFRAQNIWRQWMFDHNFPKDYGKPLSPKHGAAAVAFYGFQCTQEGDIEFINLYAKKGFHLNYWWMDAGWYPGGSWPVTGTWMPDPARFPDGIKPITDTARKYGAQTIVWFEMERVHPGTWLTENHPDWIFGGAGGGLIKLNEPEVVKWVVDRVDKILTEEKIELYRTDFNIDPLSFWRNNDAPDRQGIDSCASGGRRDDLETMRRAIPILPTDLENHPEGYQCCTYGFGMWLPFFDHTNYEKFDPYYFRSSMAPFVQCNWDVRKDSFDAKAARKAIKEWRSVADFFFADFWPLSNYTTSNDLWMAWQFDDPDKAAGLVQAFRRPECSYLSAQYRLQHLEPDAQYLISNLDTNKPVKMTGRELMEKGLVISIPERPGAALITYEKK